MVCILEPAKSVATKISNMTDNTHIRALKRFARSFSRVSISVPVLAELARSRTMSSSLKPWFIRSLSWFMLLSFSLREV
nr:hypothetical protein [Salmonella sp.]